MNDWLVSFREEHNASKLCCIACDEVDDVCCYTKAGSGPFCLDCFEALCDPDQALLLEDRLSLAEKKIEELQE